MQFDFEIEGLDELIKEVDRIEGMTDELKDEALIAGGDLLRDRYQAEVYSHYLNRRTGEAQSSITRTEPEDFELFVGTKGGAKRPGFYLYMHEFGYYNVRAKRFIPPKPTFSIIYENSKGQILDKYVEVFRRGFGMK